MLIEQFHRELKIALDKTDSSAYPEFLDGEIDIFLNNAMERFIKTRYGRNNLYRAGFEEIQKRTEDLKAVVITRFSKPTVVTYEANTYRSGLTSFFMDEACTTPAPVTEKYMIHIKSTPRVCTTACGCFYPDYTTLVQQDDYERVKRDPFNKATDEFPIMYFEDGAILVETGGATVSANKITFIIYPPQMCIGTYGKPKQECVLSEHTHREIIEIAVDLMLENIESMRQKTHPVINTSTIE